MDIDLARTFMAIVENGNFVRASRRLNVTQSTVSARIRSLESRLGRALFKRNNAACELTPAGRRFLRYARGVIRVWNEARHQLAVPERFASSLALGGQQSLWNGFLLDWLPSFRAARPATAMRLCAGMSTRLLAELQDGVHDVVVIHAPELRPGLEVERLFEDQLVLVTTDPGGEYHSRYVFLDWGESFRSMHENELPDLPTPGLSLEMGPIGLEVLLATASAGYVPARIAQPQLRSGSLHVVSGAPEFSYAAYAVTQSERDASEDLDRALEILRQLGAAIGSGRRPRPSGR